MATAEEVVAQMDESGVAQSVVFGFPFEDQGLCRMVNDYVLEAVAAWPGRLAGSGLRVRRPSPGRSAELERCLDAGLRGCGELAPDDDAGGSSTVWREWRPSCGSAGCRCCCTPTSRWGTTTRARARFGPEACVACAAAYPGLKLVFAHMGGGTFLYEAMPEVRPVLADVYYDTSAVPYLYDAGIYRAAEATAGAHKVLFGSDYRPALAGAVPGGLDGLCPDGAGGHLRRQRTKGVRAMSQAANHSHDLRRLLEALVAGDLGLEDVLQKLRLLQVAQLGEFARLDINRDLRKGVPEVVYAPRKRDADLEAIVRRFLADGGSPWSAGWSPSGRSGCERAAEADATPLAATGVDEV